MGRGLLISFLLGVLIGITAFYMYDGDKNKSEKEVGIPIHR